ncbi:MAG: hypothetical protein JNK72_07390 [Myxococcales bacterium]|nr:hypothetical protein [Myxococcales bacterium]
MSDADPTETPAAAPARRGWGYTLLKCFLSTMTLAALGAAGVFFLLRGAEAPWFIPEAVFAWLHGAFWPVAMAVGAVLGGLLGLPLSVLIVIADASRGRLKKLR